MAYGDQGIIDGVKVWELSGKSDLSFAAVQSIDAAAVKYGVWNTSMGGSKPGYVVVGSNLASFDTLMAAHADCNSCVPAPERRVDGTEAEVSFAAAVDDQSAAAAADLYLTGNFE